MSTISNAAAGPSTSDYTQTQIFRPAINSYNELTGQDLSTRCAASDLVTVNRAAVLNMFRDRMQGFNEFRNGNETLMTYLGSIVDILLAISTKLNLGENANSEFLSFPARAICATVIILLDLKANTSYNSLLTLFQRLQFSFQRVNNLTEIPYPSGIEEPLWKVMAEVLSILAVFTKMTKDNQRRVGIKPSTGIKQLEEDFENAFQRLNALTKEANLIESCIRSFIQRNEETRTWSKEEKDFVNNALSKQANGSFRWTSDQLQILHRGGSILHRIRSTPQTLGTALDEHLDKIPEEKSQDVLLLFKCLIAAFRPLRPIEVAKIFALQPNRHHDSPRYGMNLLFECRAFITFDEKKNLEVVQFSSPFVKEYLTSEHLQTSNNRKISRYHITPEAAHTALSQVCITILLQLDESVDKIALRGLPLAFYAGTRWVDHTRSGNVSQNMEIMKQLFDPGKAHLDAWIWMQDIETGRRRTMDDLRPRPSRRSAAVLYYAALCGFSELVSYLANVPPEDPVDTAKCGYHGTPLHAASYKGHLDVARALLNGGTDINEPAGDRTPLHAAYYGEQLEAMKFLLRNRANVNARDSLNHTLLHRASRDGRIDSCSLLLNYKADINARNRDGWTPLHWAALRGYVEVTQFLLDKGAVVNLQSLNNNTSLYFASIVGNLEVVKVLLRYGADASIRGEHNWTPLEAARENRRDLVTELLSSSGGDLMPVYSNKNINEVRQMERRALLVGITYSNTSSNMWPQLYGPYDDVDKYWQLLVETYDYRPGDITVLKDHPKFPENKHPTRVNMIRELKTLVSGAGPGDRFTFLYSGHSCQRGPTDDAKEEDGMDEMIITSDEDVIIDDELNHILSPLPVGCSLLAILDTAHSGTLLDLPHYHCNNVYVPWQSKSERRTKTRHNNNVRRNAVDNSTLGVVPSTASMTERQWNVQAGRRSNEPLQVDVHLANKPESTSGGQPSEIPSRRPPQRTIFPDQPRSATPERQFDCDGWCKYAQAVDSCQNVVSISACSDFQRAWEGPKGSLTTILCSYLKKNSYPSYEALMTHVNYQLYENACELHEFTRNERKNARYYKGDKFDGELNAFQEPQLSSLMRLNMTNPLLL